ncbi:hypothetical protein HN51_070530 [Arachis hypogaea]
MTLEKCRVENLMQTCPRYGNTAIRDAIDRMNGSNFDGRNITVNEAQSRGGDGFSRGGSGGGYGGGAVMKVDTIETVVAAVATEEKM